jgi:hypothetical protein
MLGRAAVLVLAGAVGLGAPATAMASSNEAYARQEDVYVVGTVDDDGEGDTGNTGNTGDTSKTSGEDSNDNSNSRHSAVSRDRDRSRGDLTKDRTSDGPGTSTRDRSRNQTNDRSRDDTR